MDPMMATSQELPRSAREPSQIGLLAERIRDAALYLISKRNWTLAALEEKLEMHKNSTMRIKDLRVAWAVRRKLVRDDQPYKEGDKTRLEEANEGDRGDDGQLATRVWMWNPQIDTFEKLERLLHLAEAEGFDVHAPPTGGEWLRQGGRRKKNGLTAELAAA